MYLSASLTVLNTCEEETIVDFFFLLYNHLGKLWHNTKGAIHKRNKLGFIKIKKKIICFAKDPFKKIKRQTTIGRKYLQIIYPIKNLYP